jgi:uncharacterized membrane protein YeiH
MRMDLPPASLTMLALSLDLTGTFVFGLSGGMLAVRRRLDLFGVIVLSTAAATAGGAIRDMAIGDQPAAVLQDSRILLVALAAGLVAFLAHAWVERLNKPVMLLDALGLGVFAVSGTQKALDFGLNPAAACLIGVLTAVGGGVVRDLLVTEIPRVLREDVYAVAAILGAALVALGAHLGWPPLLTAALGIGLTFVVRVASVRLGLRIPRAR